MNKHQLPSILQKTETFETKYLWADEFSESQSNIFWTANEINVEKDKHCILINMTESERNAVIDVLKLFTLYELRAGSDYWLGRFMRTFKRPELQRMAATFGFFELGVHKPFYAKLNEVLSLSSDEFLMSYKEDTVLSDHMQFIGDMIKHENNLVSLAAFSMVEGAVLYSSFAFLKHFQSVGKNKLINVVRGINFSVRDEACLVEGTEVLTDTGWKNIEAVEVSDNVLCYDVDGTSKFSSVLNTTKVESSTSYEFRSPDFHQHVTGPHRMITPVGEVKAENAPEIADYVNGTSKNTNVSTDLTFDVECSDDEFMRFIDSASNTELEKALEMLEFDGVHSL